MAPYAKVMGDRARFAGINTVGLKRRGFDEDGIKTIKHAYHLLFQSKLRLEPAIKRVEEECGDSRAIQHLLAFLRTSKRGVTR
ncbi:MAG: hypothetical protein ACR2P8_03315 [Myxococcota bacterium]